MANRKEKTTSPEITIVVGTLNRPTVVLKLLDQLKQIKKPSIEVLVFDQSNQKNYEQLKLNFTNNTNFYLIHLDQPNTCRYLNLGWQKAQADLVLYLDDDVKITLKTIQAHINRYKNPRIQGVAGRVINDREQITEENIVGKIAGFGAIFHKNFSGKKETFVDFPYGCNMSFRKKTLKEVGGFDEKLAPPIYSFNEVDLGYRISKKYPKSILFEPAALVYHQQFKSGGTRSYSQNELEASTSLNYGYFIGKNFSFMENILFFLRRLPYQILKEPKEIFPIINGITKAKLQKNYRWPLLLIGVFGIIAFLRFWKVPELFNFTFSEEMQAFMAWEQMKHFHRIWIGVSAANINYYLGPGFTYLNYVVFKISNGDPAGLAYFSAILGFVSSISIYYITKNIFSKKVALFATIIYGCSALINFHDRRFWNPTPIPFITIWWIYSLVKAREDTRWFILTAVLYGCAFHVHLSLLVFLIPTVFSIVANWKRIRLKTWIIMIACYLFVTSPLIVFDLVHNFDNLLMPVRTLFGKQKAALEPFSLMNIVGHAREVLSTLGRMMFFKLNTNPQEQIVLESHYGKTPGNIFLALISVIALFWFFIKNRNRGYQVFFIALLSILTAFILYPSYNPEYYLMSFLTLLAVVLGYFLNSLPRFIAILLVVCFIIANTLIVVTMSDKYGLLIRKQLVQKSMPAIQNQSFSLETYGEYPKPEFSYAGWRYLYKAYGRTPSQSNIDKVLGWLYPDEINKGKPQLHLVVADTIKPHFTQEPLYIFQSGIYYAYIFKNE